MKGQTVVRRVLHNNLVVKPNIFQVSQQAIPIMTVKNTISWQTRDH